MFLLILPWCWKFWFCRNPSAAVCRCWRCKVRADTQGVTTRSFACFRRHYAQEKGRVSFLCVRAVLCSHTRASCECHALPHTGLFIAYKWVHYGRTLVTCWRSDTTTHALWAHSSRKLGADGSLRVRAIFVENWVDFRSVPTCPRSCVYAHVWEWARKPVGFHFVQKWKL